MLVGDLVNGEIDIAVAGMTMTSEREEVKNIMITEEVFLNCTAMKLII